MSAEKQPSGLSPLDLITEPAIQASSDRIDLPAIIGVNHKGG